MKNKFYLSYLTQLRLTHFSFVDNYIAKSVKIQYSFYTLTILSTEMQKV